jgi:hypothetical protein
MHTMARIAGRASLVLGLATGSVAFATSSAPADVAARCGTRGCDYIRCDESGDRCYRISRGEGAGYSGSKLIDARNGRDDRDRSFDRGYGNSVCDGDGDRCYRSSERVWNYRDYYRGLGYHWVASNDRDEEMGSDHRPPRVEKRYDYDDRDKQHR